MGSFNARCICTRRLWSIDFFLCGEKPRPSTPRAHLSPGPLFFHHVLYNFSFRIIISIRRRPQKSQLLSRYRLRIPQNPRSFFTASGPRRSQRAWCRSWRHWDIQFKTSAGASTFASPTWPWSHASAPRSGPAAVFYIISLRVGRASAL